MSNRLTIAGKLVGHRLHSDEKNFVYSDIVHIVEESRPEGPAENAIVEVKHYKNKKLACYVPWVGYFDLDRELDKSPKHWRIVEPAVDYSAESILWQPFKNNV